MATALIDELRQAAEDANGGRTTKLKLIARKLVEKAVGGDMIAIKEVFDRVDGKNPIFAAIDVTHREEYVVDSRALKPELRDELRELMLKTIAADEARQIEGEATEVSED